jgi:hypothetical protein
MRPIPNVTNYTQSACELESCPEPTGAASRPLIFVISVSILDPEVCRRKSNNLSSSSDALEIYTHTCIIIIITHERRERVVAQIFTLLGGSFSAFALLSGDWVSVCTAHESGAVLLVVGAVRLHG